jgi:hypothetical protein
MTPQIVADNGLTGLFVSNLEFIVMPSRVGKRARGAGFSSGRLGIIRATGFPGKTEDAAAIFRCGSLTEAGKLALSPM